MSIDREAQQIYVYYLARSKNCWKHHVHMKTKSPAAALKNDNLRKKRKPYHLSSLNDKNCRDKKITIKSQIRKQWMGPQFVGV